jgi:LemA protein
MLNLIFFILLVLLIASALFDIIPWKFNLMAVVVLILVWFVSVYNSFIRLRQRVKEAESDIEVQLKRRLDLITNLVETVKGYMTHEKTVLENITQARTSFLNAKNLKEEMEVDNMITSALKSLFAVAENYPDLKANQNFLQLQQELSDTENKIMSARRFYNAVVNEYNSFIQYFPNNIFASLFGFKQVEYFDIPQEEEKRPEVKF